MQQYLLLSKDHKNFFVDQHDPALIQHLWGTKSPLLDRKLMLKFYETVIQQSPTHEERIQKFHEVYEKFNDTKNVQSENHHEYFASLLVLNLWQLSMEKPARFSRIWTHARVPNQLKEWDDKYKEECERQRPALWVLHDKNLASELIPVNDWTQIQMAEKDSLSINEIKLKYRTKQAEIQTILHWYSENEGLDRITVENSLNKIIPGIGDQYKGLKSLDIPAREMFQYMDFTKNNEILPQIIPIDLDPQL